MDIAELESLSSRDLHDRAVKHAVRHLDVGFLWRLVKAVPAAEASIGHIDEAEADVVSLTSHLTDAFSAGDEAELADALRPLYLDYLSKQD